MIDKVKLTDAHLKAIFAVGKGDATPDQQKMCIQAIVVEICGTNLLSFSPDNQSQTAYREGQRSVGVTVRELVAGHDGHIQIVKTKESGKNG